MKKVLGIGALLLTLQFGVVGIASAATVPTTTATGITTLSMQPPYPMM